jgi:hypothetical protein
MAGVRLCAILAQAVLAACLAPAQSSFSTRSVAPDQRFDLALGQEVTVEGSDVRIRFVSVAEDSRCPKGEQCITAGNARVILEVAVGNQAPFRAELNTARGPVEVELDGYRVALEGLAPEPVSGRAVRPADYLVTLSVRRR